MTTEEKAEAKERKIIKNIFTHLLKSVKVSEAKRLVDNKIPTCRVCGEQMAFFYNTEDFRIFFYCKKDSKDFGLDL